MGISGDKANGNILLQRSRHAIKVATIFHTLGLNACCKKIDLYADFANVWKMMLA